jgi:hypothetical protein
MPVNSDQRRRIMELVSKIETEKNQARFTALVHELNELLEGKSQPTVTPLPKGETQAA